MNWKMFWLAKKTSPPSTSAWLRCARKVYAMWSGLSDWAMAMPEPRRSQDICSDFKVRCTGCGACAVACPASCIDVVEDDEGFLYPDINEDRCMGCNRCIDVCPNNMKEPSAFVAGKSDVMRLTECRAWAFQANDVCVEKSSSGAAFYCLAHDMIARGGVAYGFSYATPDVVSLVRCSTIDELELVQGSKYVQGHTLEGLRMLKRDAKEGVPVLACGTTCHIAGIKRLLGEDARHVLLVDIVCHGVPSAGLFREHVAHLEDSYGSRVHSYAFREKQPNMHWRFSYRWNICFADGKFRCGHWKTDPFFKAYLTGAIMRESCYSCQYAALNRPSDITLGDYWGVERHHVEFDLSRGVSAVIAHSLKGMAAATKLEQKGVLVQTDAAWIGEANSNLIRPSFRPRRRDSIFQEIGASGYEAWARREVRFKDRLVDVLLRILPPGVLATLLKIMDRG